MLITLYVVLLVLSLVWLVGIVPAMRGAWAAASTAGGRFRAVGRVAFDKLSLPATWGTLALCVSGDRRSAPYVVFVLALVVLALFVIVALAWALAYVVPWLWRLPQSLRATYTRTPPRTS